MANEEHVAILKEGVDRWNKWRVENPDITPDLQRADLQGANLRAANMIDAKLSNANLRQANLNGANLIFADLERADLSKATLSGANFLSANLTRATLSGANLNQVYFTKANLSEATLTEVTLAGMVNFVGANLTRANLAGAKLPWAYFTNAILDTANLVGADLTAAHLANANLTRAKLTGANLTGAHLVEAELTDADLTGCRIYGTSAWKLTLKGAIQQNLIITRGDEPEITVDDIEVAQFIYLLLHNEGIRKVIDTITSKAVLILGRFTEERKEVLDGLRDELRNRGYVPVLFDFSKPKSLDITETIKVLAGLARFVIADITDATEVRVELQQYCPGLYVSTGPTHSAQR